MKYWCVKRCEKAGKEKIGHSLKIKKKIGNVINITYFNKDLTIITITLKHVRLQVVTQLKYGTFSFRNFVILVKCGDDDKSASQCDTIHVKPL
jgi:hypothetical protein